MPWSAEGGGGKGGGSTPFRSRVSLSRGLHCLVWVQTRRPDFLQAGISKLSLKTGLISSRTMPHLCARESTRVPRQTHARGCLFDVGTTGPRFDDEKGYELGECGQGSDQGCSIRGAGGRVTSSLCPLTTGLEQLESQPCHATTPANVSA